MESRKIEVLDRVALMGPNLYANQPCIRWTIDLGELEESPSNAIPGFVDGLKACLPTLVEHRCSEGKRGGFFTRLEEGTWMGHVMEHIALDLQSQAGSTATFGKTRSADREGVYNVIYQCEERETGIEAGQIALDLIEHLIAGETFPIEQEVLRFKKFWDRNQLGPSTRSIVEAASGRRIPSVRLNEQNFVQLGYGAFSKKIQATTTSLTSSHGVEIAGDKDLTKSLLGFHGIPVPKGELARTEEGAVAAAGRIGYPVVVKPLDASQGRGIVTDIRDEETLRRAFNDAKQFRPTIIIEKFVPGFDFRILTINHKVVAVAQRVPAHVIGDGTHTISELVEIANLDPRRGDSHEKVLTKIRLDGMVEHLLGRRGLTLSSVPPEGDTVFLKTTANLSTGGSAIDVTDRIHPSNIHLAQRISKLVGLDIAGIDVVATTIDVPVAETGGAIVEVNAAPGFRMHIAPAEGKSRAVGEAVIDMLFPPGTESRIPIVTITGTNGKTTTSRLLAHIAKQARKNVGLTTTEGIYINGEMITKGDCTGPQSAQVVLRDPSVDFAVLETARGGLLRAGLAYDWSDVAIVTNIAPDHLGLRGINTLEELARVKGVTVERVFRSGYAVLNAEDDMTPLLRRLADCNLALFSLDPENASFREHINVGGIGVTVEQEQIILWEKGVRVPLGEVWHVPLTFGGRARFNVANTLAAIAGSYCADIDVEDIRIAIRTFFPSVAQTPGRMNFFDVNDFTVIVDYGHNAHGLTAVIDFVSAIKKGRVIGIIGVPGDRRDQDIGEVAKIAARELDYVIIREDYVRRGRQKGEVAGILTNVMLAEGFDSSRLHVSLEEFAAVSHAVGMAERNDIILYFADDTERATKLLEEYQQHGKLDPALLARTK